MFTHGLWNEAEWSDRIKLPPNPHVGGEHYLSHKHCSIALGRYLTPVPAPGLPSPRPPAGLGTPESFQDLLTTWHPELGVGSFVHSFLKINVYFYQGERCTEL